MNNALRNFALLFAGVFLFCSTAVAQLTVNVGYTGTAGSGLAGSYTSLASAITALNGTTLTGTGTVVLTCSGTETATSGGYLVTVQGTANVGVIINGNNASTITAGLQTANSLTDAIFKFEGARYVTLQGFTMQENSGNTVTAVATNTMTEWAVALLYATTTNGCQNNTIQNNNISLNTSYSNSFGIYANTNHSPTNVTSLVAISSAAGECNNNKVYSNNISNVTIPISFSGNSTYFDSGNDIGGSSLATANIIDNWGGSARPGTLFYYAPGFTGYQAIYGLFLFNENNVNASYNTLTNGNASSTGVPLYGIYLNNLVSPGGTPTDNINYNTIGSATANSGLVSVTTSNTYPVNAIYTNTITSGMTLNVNHNTIQNCAITGTSSSAYFYGIQNTGSAVANLSVSNNTIDNNSTSATSGAFYGIYNNGCPVSGSIYFNANTIGETYTAINSSTSYAIYCAAGASGADLQIDNNVFQDFNFTNASASSTSVYFIKNTAQTTNQDISSNNYNNIQMNTSGSGYFISTTSLAVAGTKSINSNYVTTGFSINSNGSLYLLQDAGSSAAGSILQYNNNNLSNITVAGNGSVSGFVATDGGTGNKSVTGNTFSNITGSAAVTVLQVASGTSNTVSGNTISNINAGATMQGMYFNSGSGTSNISLNKISNLYSSSSGSSGYGINITGAGAYNIFNNQIIQVIVLSGQPAGIYTLASGAENIYQNNISYISTAGSGYSGYGIAVSNSSSAVNIYQDTVSTGSVAAYYYDGIYFLGASGKVNRIYQNVVYGLSNSTGVAGTSVIGIYLAGGSSTTSDTVYQNKIYNLSGGLDAVWGIQDASASTVYLFNNLISGLSSTGTATATVAGIYESSSTASLSKYIYYNTVYLTGNLTGTATSYALYTTGNATATTCNLTLADNILVNDMTPSTGSVAAIYRTVNSFANYNAASNNNLLYAGTPGTKHFICNSSGTTNQTLSLYQTATGGAKDNASVSQDEAANFVNTDGGYPLFLYLNPESTNGCYNAGVTVAGGVTLNTDYLGVARYGNAGYSGAATKPTIGAYEIIKTANDAGVTAFSLPSPLCAGSQMVSVIVTNYGTATLNSVTVNWSMNGVAQTPVTLTGLSLASGATSIALNLAIYTFTSGAYAISANTSLPNGSADGNSTNDAYAQTYSAGLNGTYTVGATGANYATLADAVADYNAAPICGPVVFLLQSNYTSTGESFPLHIKGNTGASSVNTLTVKPATGTSPNIIGTSGTGIFLLDGASYIIIDGSNTNGGTTRDLGIANSNLSAGAVLFVDGTTNSVIKNSVILSNAQSSANYLGVVGLELPTTTASNSNDTVQNNEISSYGYYSAYGVYQSGSATMPGTNNAIIGNYIHDLSDAGVYDAQYSSNMMISGNDIVDYSQTATSYGIYSNSTGNKHIVGNNIYQTTSISYSKQYGIDIATAPTSGIGDSVYNNFIGGTQAGAGGSAWTNTYSGATFYGIYYIKSGGVTANIFGNTVGNIAIGTTTGSNTFYGINVAGGAANIGAAGTGNGNTISGITLGASGATTNNTLYGVYTLGTGVVNINYNTISNLMSYGTGTTGVNRGIYLTATGNGFTVSNNNINNLTGYSKINLDITNVGSKGTSAAVVGIEDNTAATGITISGNTIYTLVSAAAATANYPSVLGISAELAGNGNVYGNKIYDLENNSVYATTVPGLSALRFYDGTWSVYNNEIIINNTTLSGTVGTNSLRIYGICDAAGTNSSYYFNSVLIGGAPNLSTSPISAAFAEIYYNSNTDIIKNNIFYNIRTNAGAAVSNNFAIAFNSTVTSVTCDYNDLYSAGNSYNYLALKGVASATFTNAQVATYRSTSPASDANSLLQQVWFTESDPPTTDLSPSPTGNCALFGKGLAVTSGTYPPSTAGTGITFDYTGSTSRNSPPDMGAIEFTSTFPTISAGSPQNACVGSTITMAGTDPASLDAFATGAWTPTTGLSSSTAYNASYTGFVAGANATQTWTVTDGSCSGNGTVVITGNAAPTATIGGTITTCATPSTTTPVTFTGAGGTAPYTFTYTINGGSNQTITTTSGNSITINASTSTGGTTTYALVSVQEGSANACSQNQTGSAVITVNSCSTTVTVGAGTPFTGTSYQPGLTSAVNGSNVNLLGFNLSASATSAVTGVSLNLTGNATSSDFSNVTLIRDVDNSGTWNTGDVVVSTGNALPTVPGTLTFGGTINESIGTGATYYLVVADVPCSSTTSKNLTAALTASNAGVTTSAVVGGTTQTGNGMSVGSFPVAPGAPSVSPSATCATSSPVTISAGGSPAGSDIWYWETAANGTSTANNASSSENESVGGTYYIRAQNSTGCWSAAAGSVAVTFAPAITPGTPTSVCPGATSSLTYTGATNGPDKYNIVWNSAATTAGFASVTNASLSSPISISTPGAASGGTYTGTLTIINTTTTCTTDYALNVVLNPVTAGITASPASAVSCAGSLVTLTAAGGGGNGTYTYTWSPTTNLQPVAGTSAIESATPTTNRTYTVTVKDGNNCSATATKTVNYITLPASETVTGTSYAPCASGATLGLASSQSGVSYQLTLGGVNQGSPVSGTGSAVTIPGTYAAGSYVIVATNASGCTTNIPATVTTTTVLSGTVTVGTSGTYTTLTGSSGLFNAINNGYVSGNIVATINSNITEPGTVALNQWTEVDNTCTVTATPSYTLTVQSDGSVRTLSGNYSSDYLIRLLGADRVTFTGGSGGQHNLVIKNQGNGVMIYEDGCMNDLLTNCDIQGGSVNGEALAIASSGTAASITISNNNIHDMNYASGQYPDDGIFVNNPDAAVTISGNNIYNFTYYGIHLLSVADNAAVTGNNLYMTVSDTRTNGAIYDEANGNGHSITGNTIGGNGSGGNWTYTAASGTNSDASNTEFDAIYYSGAEGGAAATITGNTIGNFNFSATSAPYFYGIHTADGAVTIGASANPNTISNVTVGASGAGDDEAFGIWEEDYGTTDAVNIQYNTIHDLTSQGTTADVSSGVFSKVNGIFFASFSNNGNLNNNTIYNLVSASRMTNSIATINDDYNDVVSGILIYSNPTGITVSSNTIYGLRSTTTSTKNTVVNGISVSDGFYTASGTISSNKIYDLTNTSTATSTLPAIVGIRIYETDVWNVYNNQLILTNGTNTNGVRFYGISDYAGAACNYFYNSVYMGGGAASGTAVSAAFNGFSSASNPTFYNNLMYNERTNTGTATGINYAVSFLGTTPAGFSSDYNDLYSVSTTGTTTYNNVGAKNATNAVALSNWQPMFSSPGDAHSQSKKVLFNQSNPPTTDLTPSSLTNCWLDGKGKPVTTPTFAIAVPKDYLNTNTRNATTPDIGAIEFTMNANTLLTLASGANNSTTSLAVCAGSTLSATASTSAPATLTYAWTTPDAVAEGNVSTFSRAVTAAMGGAYNLTVSDVLACSSTATATLVVNPLPTATISGGTSVCFNSTSPDVTFTGASGTAPYTFTYNINGGASQTVTTIAGNTVTVAVPTTTATTYNYNLVSVQDGSSTACSQTQTGTATVTVYGNLTATISGGTSPVCYNTSPGTFTATGSGGTGTYTYQWYNGAGAVAGQTASTYAPGNLTSSNTFYCEVTSGSCGVVNTSLVSITVRSLTSATATNGGPYVVGQTISLSSSSTGAVSYNWSGPGYSASGQTQSITGATTAMSGTYTVTATNNSGCTATASTNVTVTTNATYTWTGTTNTSWTVITNWSPNAPTGGPNACAVDVIIPVVANNYPVISSAVQIGNMQIDAGAQLTLNAANINVCKNWIGGTGATKAVIAGNGKVILNGSTAQNVSGKTEMQELIVDNTSGVSMQSSSALDIVTSLDLSSGNFNVTSGLLTFKSRTIDSVAILDNFSSGFTGTLTGNITAERYYASSLTYNQHYMGSPVNNPALSQFNPSGTPGFVIAQQCDETRLRPWSPYGTVFSLHENNGGGCGLQQWKVETPASLSNAQNAVGYSLLRAGAGTLVLSGAANLNSSYSVSGLTNSGWQNNTLQHHTEHAGWQLMSNPYLAPVNLSTVPTGFDNQVQVWNADGPYANSYQPATIGVDAAIAPFQAFMVHKTSAGGSATFTVNARDRVRAMYAFHSANASQLNIVAANIANGKLDQTTVSFNAAATDTFDAQYDAAKLPGSLNRHTLYTVNNDLWMSRNTLNSITSTSTVPMGFEPGATGTYKLTFNGLNTFDATSYIYLEDKALNVMYNVRNGDYTFTADSADNWDRFVLHFTPPAQVTAANASCNAAGTINIQQPGTANWNYTLTDAGNAIITSGTLNQSQQVTVGVPAGTYTLTFIDTNNYQAVKTIVVGGAEMVTASFDLPASASVNQSVNLAATAQGAATYLWDFGNGTSGTGDAVSAVYTQPGVYQVSLSVTSSTGCTSVKTKAISINDATGLNHVTGAGDLKIWSHDNMVYVDFTALQSVNANVIIYNILGQEINKETVTTGNLVYRREIDNVDAAYFIVMVRNDDKITTKKVFITNSK